MLKSIRKAELKDLPQILVLIEAHAVYEQSEISSLVELEQRLRDTMFGRYPKIQCLIAEHEGLIVAYASFISQYSTWEGVEYLYLDCLFIKEECRGLGLGKAFMQRIQAQARHQSIDLIQWQTPVFNKNAISFYRGLGAVDKPKHRFFWKVT
ncbi:MAG: GNAT family N-acetyltransferase [Cyclobacteriaceae bacterium]